MMIYSNMSFVLGVAVTYLAVNTIRLLYFSPLAQIPGPRLAAISRLYELYHDGYQPGGYVRKLRELHGKYGSCTSRRIYHFLTFEQVQ